MLPVCRSTEDAVAAIRSAPLDALRSAAWLEYECLPALGLHRQGTWPDHLSRFQGTGVESWQWPCQFARYLANLAPREINSYLELGISHGGTLVITAEYLRRFNPSVSVAGIDIEIQPGVHAYQEMAKDLTFLQASTRSDEAAKLITSRKWGLALIDADHSEEGCWLDYQAVRDFTELAAFHDISNDVFPGVGAVWRRLCSVLPRRRTFEFIDQYDELIKRHNRIDYGLGLAELR
jgi:hypothetical protein